MSVDILSYFFRTRGFVIRLCEICEMSRCSSRYMQRGLLSRQPTSPTHARSILNAVSSRNRTNLQDVCSCSSSSCPNSLTSLFIFSSCLLYPFLFLSFVYSLNPESHHIASPSPCYAHAMLCHPIPCYAMRYSDPSRRPCPSE